MKHSAIKILFMILISFVIGFILIAPKVYAEDSSQETSENYDTSEYYLFHSETCPHCKNVISYLEKNDVIDKVKLMEIPSSTTDSRDKVWENQELMDTVSIELNIPEDQRGSVPLMVHGDEYKMGSTEITDYVRDEFDIVEKKPMSPAVIVLLSVGGIGILAVLMYKVALS
ncbi:MAG TPA: hypothetical protein PK957_04355 [Candidatus Dojkabacteria bacterium]|nr:hypothetical protein [Candidatus Dojkabacteria bacterium]HQF36415.1 hypothetical protein [Candidatus Dojkabacteria bacterium]